MRALRGFALRLSEYEEANVIGQGSGDRILVGHVLDSLSCLLYEGFHEASRLIDVGSGGGLPGIPLKMARPDLSVSLLESTGKKARFISQAAYELGLTNIEVVNRRAEEAGRDPEYRGRYDVATVRALASLPVIVEYCVPFLRVGGTVIAMKGRPATAEISAGEKAASVLGAKLEGIRPVSWLPETGIRERCLVIVKKIRETPEKYPRKPGVPKKRPLADR